MKITVEGVLSKEGYFKMVEKIMGMSNGYADKRLTTLDGYIIWEDGDIFIKVWKDENYMIELCPGWGYRDWREKEEFKDIEIL